MQYISPQPLFRLPRESHRRSSPKFQPRSRTYSYRGSTIYVEKLKCMHKQRASSTASISAQTETKRTWFNVQPQRDGWRQQTASRHKPEPVLGHRQTKGGSDCPQGSSGKRWRGRKRPWHQALACAGQREGERKYRWKAKMDINKDTRDVIKFDR